MNIIKQFYILKLSLRIYLVLVLLISFIFIGYLTLAQQEETPTALKEYIKGQSCPNFVVEDTNNLTIKDQCTGLVWARRELPTYYEHYEYFNDNQIDPGYSWEQAKTACEEMAKINGQSVFRLPTVEELLSLLQYKCDENGCTAQIHENYGLPFFSGGRYWAINDFNEPPAWRAENPRRDYKRSVSLKNGEVDSPVYNLDMRLNAWCVIDRNPEILERKFTNVYETVISGGSIITGGDLKTVYNRQCEVDADCDPPLTGAICDLDWGFCSQTEINLPVNIYNPITEDIVHVDGTTPQQIIICDPDYHVEGIECLPNSDPEIGYWEGTETGGDWIWLPFLCPPNTIALEDGSCEVEWMYVNADGIVYDSNTTATTAVDSGGEFLKVGDVMPTPYIWIANSLRNQISKIRIFGGYKLTRAGIDIGTWENKGDVIGVYPVGSNPSRTAVNVETGDVWVASRDSANIYKLDIDGNLKKVCTTGSGPRGVAIERNGDVWIANAVSANVVKISGDDTNCGILETISLGGYPYGLAIDSQNNLWVSNRTIDTVQKIDTANPGAGFVSYSMPDGHITCGAGFDTYGITVDLNDDVWIANTCTGVWKLDHETGISTHYSSFPGILDYRGRSRGVTVDTIGRIWVSMDYSNQVLRINDVNDPMNNYDLINLTTTGTTPIGIAGDSMGQVWAVKYNVFASNNLNYVDVIISNDTIETYTINPYQTNVGPYTYSDMTGINRAMALRSGVWYVTYDKLRSTNIWGNVVWQENIPDPEQQSIEVYIEVSNDDTPSGNWTVESATWNSYPADSINRQGRYLHIKTILRSSQRGVTPVLWDFIILP